MGRCRVSAPTATRRLLNGLAVQRQIEPVAFDLFTDAQTDHQIDELQDDQRDDHVVAKDDADADALIDDLPPIAFERAGRAAIFADGEYAGEDAAGGAADAVHAEGIESVVIAEHVLEPGAAPVADDARRDAD